MKVLALVLPILFIISSCNKEEPELTPATAPVNPNVELLKGTWTHDSTEHWKNINGVATLLSTDVHIGHSIEFTDEWVSGDGFNHGYS